MLTAQRLVERSLRMYSSRAAVVDGDRSLTYGELAARTGRLANALLGFGASGERPVATLLQNQLEFLEVDVACTRSGITRVGISDRLSPDECRHILGDSQAAVLVVTPELWERVGDDLPDTLRQVIVVGGEGPARMSTRWPPPRLTFGQRSLRPTHRTMCSTRAARPAGRRAPRTRTEAVRSRR